MASEPELTPDSAAYWRGRAEMAEAQVMTGKPVPAAVADLIHERDELLAENARLRDLLHTVAAAIHEEWSMSYARQLRRDIERAEERRV